MVSQASKSNVLSLEWELGTDTPARSERSFLANTQQHNSYTTLLQPVVFPRDPSNSSSLPWGLAFTFVNRPHGHKLGLSKLNHNPSFYQLTLPHLHDKLVAKMVCA